MSKSELGTKRTDPETGRKFYDFGKDPIVSPYTGTSYPLSFFEASATSPRRPSQADMPVHREEEQHDEVGESEDEDADTVSLSDIEEDEADDAQTGAVDVDDDEGATEKADEEGFLALDEEEENVDDLVGERDEEES
jgi:uncharacterized protein (TIGR02300 family)